MFDDFQNIFQLMNELQNSNLEINTLNVVTMDQKDGVIIKMTSPDKDGVKLSGVFAKLFKEMLNLAKAQAPDMKINFKNISNV